MASMAEPVVEPVSDPPPGGEIHIETTEVTPEPVVEKKPSGSTPSAGAGTNRASGAAARMGLVKLGGLKVGTP